VGSRAGLEALVKEMFFVTIFFLFSSLIMSVLQQRQYYKLLITTGITMQTIQFNTKTAPKSYNVEKTADVFTTNILPRLRC
jgi:preprotein translocase subunit SecG